MEELYDAYCIQRRLRDGASKMVAAFNSTTGSREARESLSEANKGYRECTEVRASWRPGGSGCPGGSLGLKTVVKNKVKKNQRGIVASKHD